MRLVFRKLYLFKIWKETVGRGLVWEESKELGEFKDGKTNKFAFTIKDTGPKAPSLLSPIPGLRE